MRTKGENTYEVGATSNRSVQIMISPLLTKVKLIYLAGFAAHPDCPVVETVLLLEQFLAQGMGMLAFAMSTRRTISNTRRIRPERPDPDSSDREVTTDVLLRQHPDEEEDEAEEEDEGDDREDDDEEDEDDDGYSE
jgi:hypothetical protein